MNFFYGFAGGIFGFFLVISIFMIGAFIGEYSLASKLKDCLAIAASSDVCENKILDEHFSKKVK